MFSPSPAHFGAEPNTNTNVIDWGYPGLLPVVNKRALEFGMRAALALNCTISQDTKFDRKIISTLIIQKRTKSLQFDYPIGHDGWIDIEVEGQTKRIRIERVHLRRCG